MNFLFFFTGKPHELEVSVQFSTIAQLKQKWLEKFHLGHSVFVLGLCPKFLH